MSALKPDTDDKHTLGTSALKWKELHVHDIYLNTSIVIEGTDTAHETTLGVTAPTADATINLPAMAVGTYHLPVLDTASTTAISSTPAEINLLDAGTAGGSVTLATGDSLIIGDADDGNASKKALLSDVITLLEGASGLNSFGSAVSITDDTTSSNVTTGALKVTGGISTQENLFVGGTTNSAGVLSVTNNTTSSSSATGALKVTGGISTQENIFAGGTVNSTGNMTVGGNLHLNTDSSELIFGADSDIKLVHTNDVGLTMTSGDATASPVLELKNTNSDATGAILKFVKDKGAAGADDDVAGAIEFHADDDAEDQVKFAEIKAQVSDASNSFEGGKLTLSVASHDGGLASGIVINGGTQITDATCDTTDGDATVTMDSTANLHVGMGVIGTGIPALATVASITNSTTFELSGTATATNTDETLTFINANDEVDVTIGNGSNSTVTIPGNLTVQGTTVTVDTANLSVSDQNILINDGGSLVNSAGAGLDIEAAGAVAGFMRVASSHANLEFKAPSGSTLTLDVDANKTLTVAGNLTVELGAGGGGTTSVINQDLSSDSTAAEFATLTLSNASGLLPKTTGGANFVNIGSTDAEFGDIFVGDGKGLKLGAGQDVTILHDAAVGLAIESTGDIGISSNAGSINLGADLADDQTLKLGKASTVQTIIAPSDTAGSELYSVINTAGDTTGADGAGAILLSSVAGGMGLAWADNKDLWAEGGRAIIVANEDAADAIKLHADAGVSQTITVVNDAGTEENAIALTSTAGGVDIDAAQGKDVNIAGGQIALVSKANAGNTGLASAISLTTPAGAPGGAADTIVVTNTQGTADGTNSNAAAVQLTSTAGGIGLAWADSKDLWAEGGQFIVTANHDAANAIKLHADAGTSQTIALLNDAGTNAAAIGLTATAGGITLSATDTSNGKVTVDSDTVTFGSSNAADPLVSIENTTNDANGARLRFVKDKGAAGADNDVAGLIEFYADNDKAGGAEEQIKFAEIKAQVADASDGAEGGKLTLSVASHDGESQPGLVIQDGSVEDEVDVFIGNGSDSVTTIRGDLVVSGTTTTVNSTTLQIDDKNIELAHSPSGSEGDDASVDGGGITLKSSDTDKTITWVDATGKTNHVDAWEFSEHIVVANGKGFYVDAANNQPASVLNATTLGAGVLASSLTSVGTLTSGVWNAGAIDNDTANITTGGLLKIDVDGTAVGAAGSLTLGADGDAGLFVTNSSHGAGADHLIIENTTSNKDIVIRGNDGETPKDILTVDVSAPKVITRGGLTVTDDAALASATKLLEIDPDDATPFHVTAASKVTGALTVTGSVTGQDIVVLSDTAQDGGNGVATPLTTHATWYQTGGAETSTLAAGTEGQIKVLAMHTDGGDMVVTVTNPAWGGSGTITLSTVGQACTLQYINSKWFCIGNNGVAFG